MGGAILFLVLLAVASLFVGGFSVYGWFKTQWEKVMGE